MFFINQRLLPENDTYSSYYLQYVQYTCEYYQYYKINFVCNIFIGKFVINKYTYYMTVNKY